MFLVSRGFALAFSIFYLLLALVVILCAYRVFGLLVTESEGFVVAAGGLLVVLVSLAVLVGGFKALWWTCSPLTDVPFQLLSRDESTSDFLILLRNVLFGVVPVLLATYWAFLHSCPDRSIEAFWREVPLVNRLSTWIRYPFSTAPDARISVFDKELSLREILPSHWKSHIGLLLAVTWALLMIASHFKSVRQRLSLFSKISLYDFFYVRWPALSKIMVSLLWGTVLVLLGLWPGLLLLAAGLILLNNSIYDYFAYRRFIADARDELNKRLDRQRREDELEVIFYGRSRRRREPVSIPGLEN